MSDFESHDVLASAARQTQDGYLEILLFTLGARETFGINVFKVKEVLQAPFVTRAPNMPAGVQGLVSLRGSVIPVLSLARVIGLEPQTEKAMMVTEYSQRTVSFLVHAIDRIVQVPWNKVHGTDTGGDHSPNYVTAVTELPDGRLVSILDIETVLARTLGERGDHAVDRLPNAERHRVFFVDDSGLARRKISGVLDQMGVRHSQAINGEEAWRHLEALAAHVERTGQSLRSDLDLILVDAEMPEIDGYTLTRKIKADKRFDGIPVIMHSSLSSAASRTMGQQAGVDAYVAKFDASVLSGTIRHHLTRS